MKAASERMWFYAFKMLAFHILKLKQFTYEIRPHHKTCTQFVFFLIKTAEMEYYPISVAILMHDHLPEIFKNAEQNRALEQIANVAVKWK